MNIDIADVLAKGGQSLIENSSLAVSLNVIGKYTASVRLHRDYRIAHEIVAE
jgi:hypothetical protein